MSVVNEKKENSERSQIFHFNSSKVKQCSERIQRLHYNRSESETA